MTEEQTVEDRQTEQDDDDTCSFCGSHQGSSNNERCPYCRHCGGEYVCGSEECDWCPDEDACAPRRGG
jgi:hypothetical protein